VLTPSRWSTASPASIRSELACARAEFLRAFLGMNGHSLAAEKLAAGFTGVQILSLLAAAENESASRLERMLGRGSSSVPAPGGNLSPERALSLLLAARTRLLSADAALQASGEVPIEHGRTARGILRVRHDQDRLWARRLQDWRSKRGMATQPGSTAFLVASLRAARKEMLLALALLEPVQRPTWQSPLAGRAQEEDTLLTAIGVSSTPPADDSWAGTWRQLHQTHKLLTDELQRIASVEKETPSVGVELYTRIVASVDADRVLANQIRGLETA